MKYLLSAIVYIVVITCFAQQNNTLEFFRNDPLINKKGKFSIPSSYLKNVSYNQGLAEVIVNDSSNGDEVVRRGLINQKGKFVVAADYEKVEFSQYGIVALLDESGKWNFYSIKENKIKYSDLYNEYRIVSPTHILIFKNNKWGILSLGDNAHISLNPVYKSIEVVGVNSFKVKHFNEWELKDSTLKTINQFQYDSISFYSDSILEYKTNALTGYINFQGFEAKSNKIEVCLVKNHVPNPNEIFFRVNNNNKYGILNWKRDTIILPKFDSIIGPYDDIFVVYNQGQIGIIHNSGEVYMELNNRLEKLYPYIEERAMFVKNGKYGFIDKRGNVRVAPQYSQIRNFHEGAAAAVINGKWGFIDKDENILVQPHYSEVLDFKNGVARVKMDNKWYFVNKKGEMLKQAYDEINEANSDKWIIVKNNKRGLADINGRELLAPRYDYVEDLQNGKVIVSKMNLYGVLDYKENFIYPISMDYISYNKQFKLFLFMKRGNEEAIEISDVKHK